MDNNELLMKSKIDSLAVEFIRYKEIGLKTLKQLTDEEANKIFGKGNNSVAMIVRHINGNLISRFTDFLTSDGEKSWRNRDVEFYEIQYDRIQVEEMWNKGWEVLEREICKLSDEDLNKQVSIRGVALTVAEALARSLAHISYHVGQMVILARIIKSDEWQWISIPKGESGKYYRLPTI